MPARRQGYQAQSAVILLTSSACTQVPPSGSPDLGSTDPATSRPLAVLAGSDFQSGALSTYSLAFEMISLVLMIAVLGALVIARSGRTKS